MTLSCKTERRPSWETERVQQTSAEVQWADYPIDYVVCSLAVISHFLPLLFTLSWEPRAKTKVKKRILHLFSERHIKIHKMCLWLFSLKGITLHRRSPLAAWKVFAARSSTNSKWKLLSSSPRVSGGKGIGNLWKYCLIYFIHFQHFNSADMLRRYVAPICCCPVGCLWANFNRSSCRNAPIKCVALT